MTNRTRRRTRQYAIGEMNASGERVPITDWTTDKAEIKSRCHALLILGRPVAVIDKLK